jgi:ABC-type phosphate transport system substrate-binding protein
MLISSATPHQRYRRFVSFALLLALTVILGHVSVAATPNDPIELVVVINAKSTISRLSKKDVVDIYMGRFNTFPDGSKAAPIDSPDGSDEKKLFYQRLVGKDERKIKAYWSRLLFSGRAQPPIKAQSAAAVHELVRQTQGAIAYIPTSDLTPEMKIVYQL